MRKPCAHNVVICTLIAVGLASQASAQRVFSVSYNRPSSTVSEALGTVGGYYTRTGVAASVNRRDLSARGAIPGIPSFSSGAGQRWFDTGSAPFAIRGRNLTFPTHLPYIGDPLWSGIATSDALWYETGMSYATSVDLRPDWRVTGLPETGGIAPRDPYGRTPFTDFFGLSPAPPRETASPVTAAPGESMADMLERRNAAGLKETVERTLKLLRESTLPSLRAEVRREQLSAAHEALLAWRRMDRADWRPALLDMHIAIERDQSTVAIRALLEGLERRGDLLASPPDLAEYFGDPQLVQSQARRLLSPPIEQVWLPNDVVLRAYFAYLTGDAARAREALQAFDRMATTLKVSGAAQVVRALLEDAIIRRAAPAAP